MKQLLDTDPMPFGKWKGTSLRLVPDSYLRWIENNLDDSAANKPLLDYIKKRLAIPRLRPINLTTFRQNHS